MNVPIDISNVTLHTQRTILRPWSLEDLDDFYEYARVDGVGQMAGWLPHESKETSKMILDDFMSEKKTFAIEYEGKVIGSIGIEEYNEKELPELDQKRGREIGFVLSKAYWGLGLMPEAVREVIRYLFEEIDLDVIVCAHFIRNQQSARVQQKCGFHFIKETQTKTLCNTVEDEYVNLLWKQEWLERS